MTHTDESSSFSRKPGLKAQQIADELGARAVAGGGGAASAHWGESRPGQRLPLVAEDAGGRREHARRRRERSWARLCRYYLECLSRESGSGISLPAARYRRLRRLWPSCHLRQQRHDALAVRSRGASGSCRRCGRERGQLTLYIGYALRSAPSIVRNDEEKRIEPVLLYPIEETPEERAGRAAAGQRHSAVQSRGAENAARGRQRQPDGRSDPPFRRTGAGQSRGRPAAVG